MNKSVLTVLFILWVTSGFSQTDSVIHEKKVYKVIDGRELEVDVFYNENTKQSGMNPAIAFFHGGGWAFGAPSEFFGACERYAKKGFITFSFEYRLSVNEDGSYPHPDITPVECTKDARTAIRWIRENAEQLGVAPDKIVASGQSAGGQLALSTAIIEDVNELTDNLAVSATPNALMIYSGTPNTMEAWADMLLGDKREQIWSISPYHNLKPGLPPGIHFHGADDRTVPYWVVARFTGKTRELDNYYDLIRIEGKEHYLGQGIEKYANYFTEEILEQSDDFLVKYGFLKDRQ
ncbi:MAG: alpha/beta hydrolase [Prolixibacteraceae bacterium]